MPASGIFQQCKLVLLQAAITNNEAKYRLSFVSQRSIVARESREECACLN